MSKDPIVPIRKTRPGGMNTPFDGHYMDALQNRNKTTLLEVLGSAPPLVEEIIPEDFGVQEAKRMVYKSLKTAGQWIGRMTGATDAIGGIRQINQNLKNRFINQILYENENMFAPIQGLFREIKGAYENYVTQYQTSAAVGSFIGGGLGYAIGYTYLGPIGGSIFGWIGETLGALGFGFLEQIGFATTYGGQREQFIMGPTMWVPTDEYEPYRPLPGGGMPKYREIGVPRPPTLPESIRQRRPAAERKMRRVIGF